MRYDAALCLHEKFLMMSLLRQYLYLQSELRRQKLLSIPWIHGYKMKSREYRFENCNPSVDFKCKLTVTYTVQVFLNIKICKFCNIIILKLYDKELFDSLLLLNWHYILNYLFSLLCDYYYMIVMLNYMINIFFILYLLPAMRYHSASALLYQTYDA